MSTARHHAEWLSLVEQSGPFLSLPVLLRVFPQELDADDPEHRRLLKLAYQEWEDASDDPAIHRAWVRLVLTQTLGFLDDDLKEGQAVVNLRHSSPQEGDIRPDFALVDGTGPRLLIQVYPARQGLDQPPANSLGSASCATRMMELLHATGVRLGLVTNGEQWTLVDAPRGGTTGFTSWYAAYWLEEPITLRAFRTLLSARRFFAVAEGETLAALLAESAGNQQDVTDQLGEQVRRAVEVLIRSLDRADQDHGRGLLAGVSEADLYEAALTVMMRLVFLFSAEERGLLPLGNPLYEENYAVSPIRQRLRAEADRHGLEVLERRLDAWVGLLVTFRAVHGGVSHHRLHLPAYGGHLFDPDRFPFLEGRPPGTSWRDTPATPLPVDNRTVLHLLEALQLLQVRVPGGPAEARRLSFRALGIEQIGHVYEGLLDHTARRADRPLLGLTAGKGREAVVPLDELERRRALGEADLLAYLREETGRTEKQLRAGLAREVERHEADRVRAACGNRDELFERVRPFAGLLRRDTFDQPVVIPARSFHVCEGTDRRSSGTHYTPPDLTRPLVEHTLEPLAYVGPAEGKPREEWRLRPARELLSLKVCDMATGSGAFLVEACRYLSARLLEAWAEAEGSGGSRQASLPFGAAAPPLSTPRITPFGDIATGRLTEQIIPTDHEDRLVFAYRLVAQRCLYGVDRNPMAVEMAKLSLWLLTLARNQPFTFLDHAIRCGDSLVGLHDLDQLRSLSLDGDARVAPVHLESLEAAVRQASELRQELEGVEAHDIEAVRRQEDLLRRAEAVTARLRLAADILVGTAFADDEDGLVALVARFKDADRDELEAIATKHGAVRDAFHWPLEFPEVFRRRGGFDAVVGNPPFMGGKKITGDLGEPYREYLVERLGKGKRGNADLCAYFFLRARQLLREGGGFGLIATNTIAQGDTREVGLDQLLADGVVLPRAVPSRPWPGEASLEVAHVWGRRGSWPGPFVLDERPVAGITPYLTPPGSVAGNPHRLKANEGKSFQGSIVLGMGFVLTPEEARRLIEKDERNRDVLFPYLNGEDLNSRPDQSPSRWVINFFDWPIERAREYPDCFRIVEEKVMPERTRKDEAGEYVLRKPLPQKWWIYADKRPALYQAIVGLERVLVRARVANINSWDFTTARIVNSDQTVIVAASTFAWFVLMQNSLQTAWIVEYASSMRTDVRYTPSDCFETFPFPSSLPPALEAIGERYHGHRREVMLARQEGLTRTYNRFHDPQESADDIATLRRLHVAMDQAVAAAYGWTDLDLGHGFHATKQGVRYTLSEPARREVLARLLALNHERHAEEVKQGLHEQKKARGRKKPPTKGLFD